MDDPDAASEPVPLSEVLEREYASLGRDPAPAPDADEPSRLRAAFARRHGAPGLAALCISGGGIRSATFALGALQELARRGLLSQFDYLSTVSGGGYIGSWLTAWIHRAGGVAGVLPRLKRTATEAASEGTDADTTDPVEHLREFNSYLTPRLGLFSGDTWTLVAIVVRNLLLNWLLLAPLLMIVLALPRFLVSLLQVNPPDSPPPFPGFETVQNATVIAGLLLYCVSTYNGFQALPSAGGRGITQAQFVGRCLLPLLASGLLLVVGFWWIWDDLDHVPTLIELGLGGVALTLLSWLLHCVSLDLFRDPRLVLRRIFGPLTVASVVFGFVSGAAAYVLTHSLFESAQNADDPSFYATFAPALFLTGLLLGQALSVGFTSRTLGEPDREWIARSTAYTLLAILGWLLLCIVVLVVPHFAFAWGGQVHTALGSLGVLAGWVTSFARGGPPGAANADPGVATRAASLLRKAALPVFLLLLMLGLTMLTNVALSSSGLVDAAFWSHHTLVETTPLASLLGFVAVLLAFTLVMGRYININTFSLHAMYRDRLVRAYLAASNRARKASAFTGFDEGDDVRMADLAGQRPLHVLNLTLNLVSGRKLAWQQRKAESLTLTSQHAGSRLLGYRDSARYGGRKGVFLGTAMTISGAAASPNMGYNSSPLVSFTMMLFNARLGWWLGNPGPAGRRSWRMAGPRFAIGPVVREMLGLTDDQSPYCYLSDGGHFENLALYEMVLRRCRSIVVLDGGCDPDFTYEDLGNALRKVRIDFGIPIEFGSGLEPLVHGRKRAALARIVYSAVDEGAPDGWLLYLKPRILGDEPPDVRSYAAAHPAFPHQSTSNQWFNEAQTESYRMLGQHTVAEVCNGWPGGTLEELVRHIAESYLGGVQTGPP
jgi:hypothetical protein